MIEACMFDKPLFHHFPRRYSEYDVCVCVYTYETSPLKCELKIE